MAVSVTTRNKAFLLLALANLFWAGNWVIGRGMRELIDPVSLNFWRWLLAALVLAPFAFRGVVAQGAVIRRHAGLIVLLALTGVVLFQVLVYSGLRTTTTVNAVLINSTAPLFFVLCSWAMERERARAGQLIGMMVSLAGILIILSRGDWARLTQLQFQSGDAWILLAMPIWGIYSVLLKRRPPEIGGVPLLFLTAMAGVALLLPALWFTSLRAPLHWPAPDVWAGILYVAMGASIGAFICWNRGVAAVGANAAGITLHLLPAFGTVLAILFLGETFQGFHALGIATILAGVVLATRTRKQLSR